MATTDDQQETKPLRREVDLAIIEAFEAKRTYRKQAAVGQIGTATQKLLLDSASGLYEILKWWQNREELQEIWEEYNIDEFGRLLNETTTVAKTTSARTSQPNQREVRLKAAQLPASELDGIIDGLLQSAKALGFSPQTKEHLPREKGTLADIRWLVNARDQQKAIEELEPPAHRRDPDEAATDGGAVAAGEGGVQTPSPTEPEPDAELQGTGYPFRGPFFQEIAKRKKQGRDAKILVGSSGNETGVGKSTCAFFLAHVLDTSPTGYIAEEQATLSIHSFLNAYDELEKGSALILDEAEQLTGRRALRQENVDAIERWAMRRVEEIISLLTMPHVETLDIGMKQLADYRIDVERRGKAIISKAESGRFQDETYWEDLQIFEYPAMDCTRGMQTLHDKKDEFTGPEGEDASFVREDEAEEMAEKRVKEELRETEKERAQKLRDKGLSYGDIADVLNRSKSTVHDWVE